MMLGYIFVHVFVYKTLWCYLDRILADYIVPLHFGWLCLLPLEKYELKLLRWYQRSWVNTSNGTSY